MVGAAFELTTTTTQAGGVVKKMRMTVTQDEPTAVALGLSSLWAER
jgi:hypothetical protein